MLESAQTQSHDGLIWAVSRRLVDARTPAAGPRMQVFKAICTRFNLAIKENEQTLKESTQSNNGAAALPTRVVHSDPSPSSPLSWLRTQHKHNTTVPLVGRGDDRGASGDVAAVAAMVWQLCARLVSRFSHEVVLGGAHRSALSSAKNKYRYLGLYDTEEEAAAYGNAGPEAVTSFKIYKTGCMLPHLALPTTTTTALQSSALPAALTAK
eukprot:jgi/Chlat1/892/Chrsp107S01351